MKRWVVIFRCRLCLTAYVMETISFDSDELTPQEALKRYRRKEYVEAYHNCARANTLAMGFACLAGIIEEEKWKTDQEMHLNWTPTLA